MDCSSGSMDASAVRLVDKSCSVGLESENVCDDRKSIEAYNVIKGYLPNMEGDAVPEGTSEYLKQIGNYQNKNIYGKVDKRYDIQSWLGEQWHGATDENSTLYSIRKGKGGGLTPSGENGSAWYYDSAASNQRLFLKKYGRIH